MSPALFLPTVILGQILFKLSAALVIANQTLLGCQAPYCQMHVKIQTHVSTDHLHISARVSNDMSKTGLLISTLSNIHQLRLLAVLPSSVNSNCFFPVAQNLWHQPSPFLTHLYPILQQIMSPLPFTIPATITV